MNDTAVPPTPPALRRRSWRDFLPRFQSQDWPVWIVLAICVAVFIWQKTQPYEGQEFAFYPGHLEGRWWSFFTSMFLHGGYMHIGSNMYSYLSIAPWVIARFGGGMKALVPYHLFYLLCGLAGNAMFWLFRMHGDASAVGASGAIYGVIAAMLRLDPHNHALYPVISRQTLKSLWFFVWSNLLVIAIFGGLPSLLGIFSGHIPQLYVAWEAHLGGFIAGFFLIGLMAGTGWPQAMEKTQA